MTCATEGCERVERCPLVGGCVVLNPRFRVERPTEIVERDLSLREDAKALNGTKGRTVRDPRVIKRKRKALTP
jgi:hypothetical protein